MPLWLAIVSLLIGLPIILKSADLIVGAIVHLAKRLHVSEFNMGFFILGLATTTPELFIGVNAALDKQPQLALGNLIGATIVLLTLIIGLSAIFNKEVLFVDTFNQKDLLLTSLIMICPAFFLFDGQLSRFEGLFLVIFYIVYYFIMNRKQTFMEHVKDSLETTNHLSKTLIKLVLGIGGLFISSKLVVEGAEAIAILLNLPIVLIGLLLFSIGTNLPELVVLFKSIQKHHKQVGTGDFLGSAVANTLVLGIVALIHPITLDAPFKVIFSLGILVLTLLTFNAFFSIDRKITRPEGVALLAIYSFFLFSEIFIQSSF